MFHIRVILISTRAAALHWITTACCKFHFMLVHFNFRKKRQNSLSGWLIAGKKNLMTGAQNWINHVSGRFFIFHSMELLFRRKRHVLIAGIGSGNEGRQSPAEYGLCSWKINQHKTDANSSVSILLSQLHFKLKFNGSLSPFPTFRVEDNFSYARPAPAMYSAQRRLDCQYMISCRLSTGNEAALDF